ncbi:MAG: MotA/TolQ/ExbB proton channel family protein [candidate division KSB1 bacterium]|nr:MotA/TolQ/ExbB proton channel family protein [candidate division KSB1 bacterium]
MKYYFTKLKWHYLAILVVAGLIIGSISTSQAVNKRKQAKAKTTQKAEAKQNQDGAEKELSAWDIIEMTDWLFWPFVLLTGTGIFLLSYKGLQEYREKSRAKWLLEQKIGSGDIRRVIRMVQTSQPNRASRLMHQMIATFNKTKRAEPIGDDINAYLNAERDSFETFNRVLGFLSDTAGALGLLGTVWGIFETFHAGRLDGPTILQGMSISLVTTLVGLIISLFLNMGATGIFAFFNRQLNMLANRAEELRQALLYLEAKSMRAEKVTEPEPRVRTVNPDLTMAAGSHHRRPAAEVPVTEVESAVVEEGNGYL